MYVIIVCALSHPSARLLLHGALSFYYRITDVTMRSRLRVWKTFELQILSVCAAFKTQHHRQEEVSGGLWIVSQTFPRCLLVEERWKETQADPQPSIYPDTHGVTRVLLPQDTDTVGVTVSSPQHAPVD